MPTKKGKRIRIAVIFPKDSSSFFSRTKTETFGGANVQLYQIASELLKNKNIDTFWLTSEYGEMINKPYIYQTFKNSDNLFIKSIKYHKVLSEIKPDVIIQRGLTIFSCLLSFYARIMNMNYIFMYAHNNETTGHYQKNGKKCALFWLLQKCAALLICQSHDQYNNLKPIHRPKAEVIKSSFPIKKRNNKKNGSVLWVGRLEKWKRPELYIKLAESLPKIRFTMIAPFVRGHEDYAQTIYKMADSTPNIELIEYVPFSKIDSYFRKASVFINTSTVEGFPNTFIQATKNCTPIISIKVNPDNFLHNYNCGIACNDDIKAMLDSLKNIIKNKTLYRKLSLNAYNYAKSNHDIQKNTASLLDTIRRRIPPIDRLTK